VPNEIPHVESRHKKTQKWYLTALGEVEKMKIFLASWPKVDLIP